MRRVCSLLVALQLSASGACMKDDPAPSPTATAPSSSAEPTTPSTPTTPATPVAAPAPDAAPRYAAKLEDVLALVPKGATAFAIVRDPAALMRGAAWVLDAERKSLDAFVAATDSAGKPPPPELRTFLAKYGPLVTQLAGDLQLERGATIASVNGVPVFVFAATASDALTKAVTAVGLEMPADLLTCKSMPEPAGIVACAEDAKAFDGLVLGDAPGERLAQLKAKLPGLDLERANVIAVVDAATPNEGVAWVVETTPGRLQFDVQIAGVPAGVRGMFTEGTPTALEAVAPGTTFVWGRVDPAGLAPYTASVPAPFDAVVKSVTGEFLYTSVVDPFAMVVLAGVTNPAPFRGAMAMTMIGVGEGTQSLPDGTKVDVKLENIAVDGGTVQAVHASLGDRPELAQFAQYGIKGDGFVFAVERWIAVAVGTESAVVPKIAKVTGAGPSTDLLGSLPEGLARALGDGKAMLAWHLSFDALQSPTLRKTTADAIASLPKDGDPVTATAMAELLDLLGPLSSASGWLTWNDVGPQVHLAVQGFSDPVSEEGKAAQVALGEVAGGNDPGERYGALADRFADSPRALSYRLRAGRVAGADAASLGAVALVGVFAAIAIPAVVKYRERAAAAGG